jgi:AI-2 transport protein TqsA
LRQDRLPAERLAAGRSSPDRQAREEPVPVADRESRGVLVWLLAPITLIVGAAALKLSAEVTMPLAFAYFLAVLVQPLQVWLQAHLPRWLRWLAVPLTMLTVVAVVALAISLLSMSLEPVISRGPDYAQRFQDWLGGALGWGRAHGIQLPQAGELGGSSLSALAKGLPTGLNLVGGAAGLAVLIFFFALLMLVEASAWERKAEKAFGHSEETREAVAAIAHKVRSYLLVRSFSGALSGTLVATWLWLIGVDFTLLWGLMFYLLNYAPTVGSIIAGVLAVLVAFLQLGPLWAAIAAGGIIAIDQAIGNVLDPRLQGRALDISPLVVLLSVIFWGWIWGVPGMILAVPMTATLITLCELVPALQPAATLMSGGSEPRQNS